MVGFGDVGQCTEREEVIHTRREVEGSIHRAYLLCRSVHVHVLVLWFWFGCVNALEMVQVNE
jgi:hypothetical protein